MEIIHKESLLVRLTRLHQVEPIELIKCNQEEFDEIYDEVDKAGLIDKSDDYWFTVKDVNFSIHLVT
jgi:hypothetical protein